MRVPSTNPFRACGHSNLSGPTIPNGKPSMSTLFQVTPPSVVRRITAGRFIAFSEQPPPIQPSFGVTKRTELSDSDRLHRITAQVSPLSTDFKMEPSPTAHPVPDVVN